MKHPKKILSVAIALLLLFSTTSSVFAAEPPAAPSISLAVDTGYPGDNITQDGTMNVGNLEVGATWEYSINSGVNWTGGTGTTFVLPDGTYTAGMIQARQALEGVYSDSASNITTIVVAQNQIYNGDFQLGRTGFTTDYWYNSGDCQIEGTYTVTSYSRYAHPSFVAALDHTYANWDGRMFVANGSYDITNVVWQSTSAITVQAGQDYRFEAYLASFSGINTSAADGEGYPKLKFQIGDGTNWVDLGTSNVDWGTAALGAWFAIYADGTFSTEGTYYIRLINQQPDNFNDFGVDDIYFGLRGAAPSASDPTTSPTSTPATFNTSSLLSLELQSDTGYSDNDKITYNGVVNVTGIQFPYTWQYSVDGGSWVTGSASSFTVTGNGFHSVVVRQMDESEMWSEPSAPLNFTLDVTPPSVEISSTQLSPTNATPIPIVLTFSEDVYGLNLDDITVTNGTKSNLLGSGSSYTLDVTPTDEGTVTVLIENNSFLDIAGNSNKADRQFSITYDNTPPADGSVTINSGASYTNSTSVTLALASAGATQMMISENADFSGASFESYATSKSFTLSSTNGTKTIYVKYADTAGNETTPVSDTIILDTQKPIPTITSTKTSPTNASPIPITVTFNESVTDFTIDDVTVSNGTKSNFSGSGTTYTLDVTPTAEGVVAINVYGDVAQDLAGNTNAMATTFSITYDTTPPVNEYAYVAGGAVYTNNRTITLLIGATDAYEVILSENIDFTGASYQIYTPYQASFQLSEGDGLKLIYVKFRDEAGNESGVKTVYITLDTAAPTASITSTESSPTNAAAIPISVQFNETVFVFSASDITVTNGTVSNLRNDILINKYAFDIIPTADGEITVDIDAGVVIDLADNYNVAATQFSIVSDRTPPSEGTISINDGDSVTNQQAVMLDLSATGASFMMISESSTFEGASYESYATSKSFTLSDIDGTKTIYVKYKDPAGNETTETISASILMDTTPPTNGTILINDGDAFTAEGNVELKLSADDAVEMIISDHSDFSGASYEAYATSKSFTLSSGDGTKIVYVKYKDDLGNETEAISDRIVLDTTAPTNGSISINKGASVAGSRNVTLSLFANEATEMIISENADFSGASYEAYATSKSFTLSVGDGTKTVYAKYKDASGNETDTISDRIVLDTYIAPSEPLYGTVSGYITDENGNPIQNVLVQLRSDPRQTYTDADGYFEFADVSAGEHMLYILDDRFETSSGLTVAISSTVNGVCTEDECGGDELDDGLKVEVGESQELTISFVAQADMTTGDDTDDTDLIDQDQPTAEPTEGLPRWAFWLIGVGVLGAIFFIILGKRRKDDEEEEE